MPWVAFCVSPERRSSLWQARLDGKCNISGERIKSARTKAKLTQDQLAARLQVAGLQMGQMAISRIESGKRLVPDFELPIIAEALNVSIDWLLGIEKE